MSWWYVDEIVVWGLGCFVDLFGWYYVGVFLWVRESDGWMMCCLVFYIKLCMYVIIEVMESVGIGVGMIWGGGKLGKVDLGCVYFICIG